MVRQEVSTLLDPLVLFLQEGVLYIQALTHKPIIHLCINAGRIKCVHSHKQTLCHRRWEKKNCRGCAKQMLFLPVKVHFTGREQRLTHFLFNFCSLHESHTLLL